MPVVVENKPGASGSIGVAAIASAPADGYTIGIGGIGQLALNPTLYSRLPYDAQNGFTTIAIVYRGPMLFMVDPASPITSMKDLVQQSQASPTGLDFASAGAGSIMHLMGEQFARTTRAKMTHVPNRGTGAAATARTNASLLKQDKSCAEPPPRVSTMTSYRCCSCAMPANAIHICAAASSPCTSTGQIST